MMVAEPDKTDATPRVALDRTIEVLEERLHVGKREVETGLARVHMTVSERDETVESLLMRQDVTVERIAIGSMVTEAPAVRREGDTIIVPVMEEVLVVEKRLLLKEELHIRIDENRQAHSQVVRLRTEHADIEHVDLATGVPQPRAGDEPQSRRSP